MTSFPQLFAGTIYERSPAQIQENVLYAVQGELMRSGFFRGVIDGRLGPATSDAIVRLQQYAGLPVSGRLDNETLNDLRAFPGQRNGPPEEGFRQRGWMAVSRFGRHGSIALTVKPFRRRLGRCVQTSVWPRTAPIRLDNPERPTLRRVRESLSVGNFLLAGALQRRVSIALPAPDPKQESPHRGHQDEHACR